MISFGNSQESLKIRYHFQFEDGGSELHEVSLDIQTLQLQENPATVLPEWTRLENHQCTNCPLQSMQHPHCPAAVAVSNLSAHFGHRTSYEPVQVTVQTPHRSIAKQVPLQEGLFPLLGLRMATSGCPVLAKLRPMARFHLPFADADETFYRAISMFLVGQFLRHSRGLSASFDLQQLRDIYEQVHQVNLAFAQRIRAADSSDANINSLTTLDMFAQDVPFSIETALANLQTIFSEYL